MPRPPESPDVRASKSLAYILRHGAEKEGLHIRSDGYIKLNDVLARPKMRDIDITTVFRLVAENSKKRFELLYGYDPSPPRPRKKPVQGPSKKEKAALRAAAQAKLEAEAEVGGGTGTEIKDETRTGEQAGKTKQVDAAVVDDLRHDLTKASLVQHSKATQTKAAKPTETESKPLELPLVILAPPDRQDAEAGFEIPSKPTSNPSSTPQLKGEYFIRASQGHSINLESTAHLTPVLDDDEGRRAAGEMVHGTRYELWDVLKSEGLSRMTRQHIHLAPSFSGSITPRNSSTLYIHLNLKSLLEAGIPVYVSNNGVILSPGDENGLVKKEHWRLAWKREKGKKLVIWENGEEVQRELTEEEDKRFAGDAHEVKVKEGNHKEEITI